MSNSSIRLQLTQLAANSRPVYRASVASTWTRLLMLMVGAVVLAPLVAAQDLASYREFRLGTTLTTVAKQVRMKPTEARTIYQLPALIQELEWQAPYLDPKRPADSVRGILFSFYNGELFRLVVTYDRERTEGLTVEDFSAALSGKYGTASKPSDELRLVSIYFTHDGGKIVTERSEKVISRWEDAEHSYNLIQSYPSAPFGLVIYAKRLATLAQTASLEAVRLEQQDAPRKELERQKQLAEAARVQLVEARRTNKTVFRP